VGSAGNAGGPTSASGPAQGGTSGPSEASGDGGLPEAGVVTSCGGANGLGATVARGYRRLSKREYNNVVRDLLGDTTQPANQFPSEDYVNGYDNGSAGLTADLISPFVQAAQTLAATAVANNLPALIGACDPTQNPDVCVYGFLATFAPRAYRRPITATEQQALLTAYAAGAAPTSSGRGGFTSGLRSMLETLLTSHPFLFREELGGTPAYGVVALTDYEVASELSFLVTGSMPDDALFAAVNNGSLKTVDDYLRELQRLLATPAAKPALRAFAHQWLGTTQLTSTAKDPLFYPSWNPMLALSMATELDQYFDQVFFAGTGSLRELFTSPQAFVDSSLAPIYGAGPPMGGGFQPLSLDSTIRAGVLTRAGWLTEHSDFDNSGPVARGVAVRANLLCSALPAPPPNVPPPPTASATAAQMKTTRQALEAIHEAIPECAACHRLIDDIGYGFEEFDALGQYRTTENMLPIDDSGQLISTDIDGPFQGATQLEQKLLTSKEFLACFVTQVYRDAMGQLESADAAPTIADMQRCFSVDASVTAAFSALVREPAFVLRKAQ
jgi:hypothetical protein